MHHSVSGINSLTHSVSHANHVSTRLMIHLSAHLCHHHHHSRHHSLTPGLQPTFSTNPPYLNTPTLDCIRDHGSRFTFSSFFKFNFSVCVGCGGLSWLQVNFLLHVKYTISYHFHCRPKHANCHVELINLISLLTCRPKPLPLTAFPANVNNIYSSLH